VKGGPIYTSWILQRIKICRYYKELKYVRCGTCHMQRTPHDEDITDGWDWCGVRHKMLGLGWRPPACVRGLHACGPVGLHVCGPFLSVFAPFLSVFAPLFNSSIFQLIHYNSKGTWRKEKKGEGMAQPPVNHKTHEVQYIFANTLFANSSQVVTR
jgi:hypothetical protein